MNLNMMPVALSIKSPASLHRRSGLCATLIISSLLHRHRTGAACADSINDNQPYINSPQCPASTSQVDIKVEVSFDPTALCLLSPPSSPSFSQSVSTQPTSAPRTESRRRAYTSAIPYSKRARLAYSREIHQFDLPITKQRMAQPPFHTWPSSGVKSEEASGSQLGSSTSAPRRASSDSGEQQYASYPTHYPETYLRRPVQRADNRPHSSSSTLTASSLTGAMGDTHISPQSGSSDSPSPTAEFAYASDPRTQNIMWNTQGQVAHDQYNMTDPSGSMTLHSMPQSATPLAAGSPTEFLHYQDYNISAYPNISPQSHSPDSPGFGSYQSGQYGYHQGVRHRSQPSIHSSQMVSDAYSSGLMGSMAGRPSSREQLEMEIRRLRQRVQEMEFANAQLMGGGSPLAGGAYGPQYPGGMGLPSPANTPIPSSSFQASWKARTDARIRIFCSLNRAGNALCAWHDSRRERRTYPPRMAPAGYLNCGCTYDEALFEESLARHGVGSYHPGESVRMDPALRNPLLKLLQSRYGYRDGDFERDPITGNWVEGEGHKPWEEKVMSGASAARRRTDERR
ncbi:hypothetical protein OE88DRAFT_1665831 [Heliocybe sulcata]|uniref:Uncharacterized protein n=1 Tax=Heliocybe sulcata TaxID=5364 RepID=A0A5C3MQB8_9AGAM|nr:hypothetical protein OE88DRAFT_1665831 [Heliocybe sulcata]